MRDLMVEYPRYGSEKEFVGDMRVGVGVRELNRANFRVLPFEWLAANVRLQQPAI